MNQDPRKTLPSGLRQGPQFRYLKAALGGKKMVDLTNRTKIIGGAVRRLAHSMNLDQNEALRLFTEAIEAIKIEKDLNETSHPKYDRSSTWLYFDSM